MVTNNMNQQIALIDGNVSSFVCRLCLNFMSKRTNPNPNVSNSKHIYLPMFEKLFPSSAGDGFEDGHANIWDFTPITPNLSKRTGIIYYPSDNQ
jgi:hypothetical protein